MSQYAGREEGWKLLQAMGVDPSRRIKKATITIEPMSLVMLTVEEFVQPVRIIGEEVVTLVSKYELVERKDIEVQ